MAQGKKRNSEEKNQQTGKQVSPMERLIEERGEGGRPAANSGAGQEISNRSIEEEERRQSKVVPIRNRDGTTRHRRAS